MVEARNYFGLDHEAVNRKFEGGLTFVNTIPISTKFFKLPSVSKRNDPMGYNIDFYPWAVYHCKNPNKEKGHKEYLLITMRNKEMFVSGRTKEEIEEDRFCNGIQCRACKKIIVSISQHDYLTCGCPENTMIDGGKEYERYGSLDLGNCLMVKVDMIERKVIGLSS